MSSSKISDGCIDSLNKFREVLDKNETIRQQNSIANQLIDLEIAEEQKKLEAGYYVDNNSSKIEWAGEVFDCKQCTDTGPCTISNGDNRDKCYKCYKRATFFNQPNAKPGCYVNGLFHNDIVYNSGGDPKYNDNGRLNVSQYLDTYSRSVAILQNSKVDLSNGTETLPQINCVSCVQSIDLTAGKDVITGKLDQIQNCSLSKNDTSTSTTTGATGATGAPVTQNTTSPNSEGVSSSNNIVVIISIGILITFVLICIIIVALMFYL